MNKKAKITKDASGLPITQYPFTKDTIDLLSNEQSKRNRELGQKVADGEEEVGFLTQRIFDSTLPDPRIIWNDGSTATQTATASAERLARQQNSVVENSREYERLAREFNERISEERTLEPVQMRGPQERPSTLRRIRRAMEQIVGDDLPESEIL